MRLARRFARPLAYLIVAAQLLLAAPAMASAPPMASGSTDSHCGDMPMPAGGDGACPCCPDGSSMTDCLVSCLLAAVAAPSPLVVTVTPTPAENFRDASRLAHRLSEPPLKPPPIA